MLCNLKYCNHFEKDFHTNSGYDTYEAHPKLFQNDGKYCSLHQSNDSFFISGQNCVKMLSTDFTKE